MTHAGRLGAIYIYPVKSLAAVPLDSTRIEPDGLPGDRVRALFVRSGHAREGKTYRGKENNLLHLESDAARAAGIASGRGVTVDVKSDAKEHFFDAMPVSLIFDRWVDEVSNALGLTLDPRRWRPNLFARASAGFDMGEEALVGSLVEIGDAILRVAEPIGRCVTTTYDIETGESNPDVLRYVAQHRGNRMGVYCVVERAGTVRAGDDLRLRAR